MIKQKQFGGLPSEDPNDHVEEFLAECDSIRIEGAPVDAIRLRLFSSSLRDRAKSWLKSLPAESITTWEQLEKAFVEKFFPPSKTAHIRSQITGFLQKEGESLSEAWDRFKGLLESCPHHGLEKWLIVHTFYNGLQYPSKVSLDSVAGGALMNRPLGEAYNVIESVATNHHQWGNERAHNPKKISAGKFEVDSVDLIMAKFDALNQRFDKLEKPSEKVNAIDTINVVCGFCQLPGHATMNCQYGVAPSQETQVEHVDAFNSLNQRRQNDPFSPTYNPGWRSHPNFSYRNNQDQAGAPQVHKSKLESLLESFVEAQTKQNESVNGAIKELTSKVDNLVIHNKMLETQIAQQAASSSRPQGRFPGQPEVNPTEHCKAVALRSGKQT